MRFAFILSPTERDDSHPHLCLLLDIVIDPHCILPPVNPVLRSNIKAGNHPHPHTQSIQMTYLYWRDDSQGDATGLFPCGRSLLYSQLTTDNSPSFNELESRPLSVGVASPHQQHARVENDGRSLQQTR